MTRKSLSRTLVMIYGLVLLVIALSIFAKFAEDIPGLPPAIVSTATRIYEVLRDMSLLIATGGVAYITSVFQRRSNFVEGLEEAWRGIVATKSALYAFCEKSYASSDDYVAAFCRLSETIDNMRIVYRNVGETDGLVGLYPYAPLHDMRRALQSIDPRQRSTIPPEERKLVRDAILQCFYALRENFLEELDLEQPVHPLLISGGRRLKSAGSTPAARKRHERQRLRQSHSNGERPDIDALLARLYEAEQDKMR